MIWQDARSGLALNPKKYDIIQAQPLYLKQAGSALLIDVRTDQEASTGVIRGARHIALEKLEDVAAELPNDREVLIYCANGIRAEMAHETLNRAGIRNRYLNETVFIKQDGSYRI